MDFYEQNNISLVGLANVRSRSRLLDNRSRERLLRNAFWMIRNVRKWRGRTLQHFVADITSHGSGYSWQICEELGWDPDMKITPTAELPPFVEG
jgi:hypothetical protein